jgi:hypothetical protein
MACTARALPPRRWSRPSVGPMKPSDGPTEGTTSRSRPPCHRAPPVPYQDFSPLPPPAGVQKAPCFSHWPRYP